MTAGTVVHGSGRRWLLFAAPILSALIGCSAGSAPVAPSSAALSSVADGGSMAPATLTIYGAASLRTALDQITTAYRAVQPTTTIQVSTDSSAALETQIEQGAPADVFLSADTANPRKLVSKGLALGDVVPFATNALTVIVPAVNPAGIWSPADLARPGLEIVAAGDAVPISTYGKQVVANLAREPGYPAGFVAAYEANVVSREDNVSGIVSKVALGEADAGIVYVTDARAARDVRMIPLPAAANVAAIYGAVVVGSSRQHGAAEAFLRWLLGADGQRILAELGFGPPPTV